MKLKIVILLLFPVLSFSQLSTKVDSLYAVINATDQVKNGKIGMGSDAIVYLDYENLYTKLDSLATDDEIIYIAEKGNEVIKSYMSGILVNRKSKYLSRLFSQYLFNNDEIYIQTGCTGYQTSFAADLYQDIFYQKNKIDEVEMYKKIYSIEELKKNYMPFETKWTKPEVDSLLTILNKTALSNDKVLTLTLDHIFRLNDFKFDNYERVKHFAYQYPTPEILATLASFQNKKDLPLFHQNIDNAFIAISKFPDESFLPELEKRVVENYNNQLFIEASTSFCNQKSFRLIQSILTKFNSESEKEKSFFEDEGIGYLYKCLEKKECSFNDDFLLKLWLTQKTISLSFFDKIKNKHYDEILKGYLNPIPINFAPIKDSMDWEKYSADFEKADGYYCPIILNYLKSNSSRNKDKSIDLDSIECKG